MSSVIKAAALGHYLENHGCPPSCEWTPDDDIDPSLQWDYVDERSSRRTAVELLSQARRDAVAMLAGAEAEAHALREEAQREGYTEGLRAGREQGWAEGHAEGLAAGRESGLSSVQETLEKTQSLLVAAKTARQQALANMEGEILELSLSIAEKIVHREITRDGEYLSRLISDALEQLGQAGRVVVRVSTDESAVPNESMSGLARLAGDLQIVPDETLSLGDCVIETDGGLLGVCLRFM